MLEVRVYDDGEIVDSHEGKVFAGVVFQEGRKERIVVAPEGEEERVVLELLKLAEEVAQSIKGGV